MLAASNEGGRGNPAFKAFTGQAGCEKLELANTNALGEFKGIALHCLH